MGMCVCTRGRLCACVCVGDGGAELTKTHKHQEHTRTLGKGGEDVATPGSGPSPEKAASEVRSAFTSRSLAASSCAWVEVVQEVIFEGGGWTVPSSVEGTIFLPEVLMTMYMCMCMCVCAGLLSVSAGSPYEYNQISFVLKFE
jgi:hypothetical protein